MLVSTMTVGSQVVGGVGDCTAMSSRANAVAAAALRRNPQERCARA
jgi:hypothetical protein